MATKKKPANNTLKPPKSKIAPIPTLAERITDNSVNPGKPIWVPKKKK